MGTKWLTTIKPSFQTEWLALPPKETHQVLEKITLLTEDPLPDAKVKKQLKYIDGKLHRIRCGDYRIFYTFEEPYISLLALRRREDDTYDEEFDVEFLGGLDTTMQSTRTVPQPDWERIFAPRPQQKVSLPEPITGELLNLLLVPAQYHARLLLIRTQEDLLSCPGVPDEFLLKIDETMFERPLAQIIHQPDYVLQEVEDLKRFKDGELLDFLLKLSPEQEKVAKWAKNATGPTQVKGSPGTGKSTVALYRIRSLIENLRKMDKPTPRILYTTYTNALVTSSAQLLGKLLGDDINCVEITTADKLVVSIMGKERKSENRMLRIAEEGTLLGAITRAIQQYQSEVDASHATTLEVFSHDYLLDEIRHVIIARKITALVDYLAIEKKGRQRLRFTDMQKEVIWRVYEIFLQQLEFIHQDTWQQVRLEAERISAAPLGSQKYDAVVVDEAQDLDPGVIRLLVGMCKINRFFITADANQSIYRREFNWSDVHESLNFQGGRTNVLKTNYRSTRQISEAALSYLAKGAMETESLESEHMYGGTLPLMRKVNSEEEEINLLASFLPGMARECRLLTSSCAVLCPTREKGVAIAGELTKRGITATFMERERIDLKFPGVKVLTLHSSKGLEFPIVALAGFKNSRYDHVTEDVLDEERNEIFERGRRTLFVGMTRAMRTLLIIVPAGSNSPLLEGFNEAWNLGG